MSNSKGEPSCLLAGRYELGDVIGRGGRGVVHRAWDVHLYRYVAIKILQSRLTDQAARARFRAEGETLAGLGHPALVALYDAQTQGDEPYLVIELVAGQPLSDLCRGCGLDVQEVAKLGVRLADALAYGHEQRIMHGDIKPSNVLIGQDGQVKLADFGLSRLLGGLGRQATTGITAGPSAYLSPEQVRGEPLTPGSDVYSLGLALIE